MIFIERVVSVKQEAFLLESEWTPVCSTQRGTPIIPLMFLINLLLLYLMTM